MRDRADLKSPFIQPARRYGRFWRRVFASVAKRKPYFEECHADEGRWRHWFHARHGFDRAGYRRGAHADQRWHPILGREAV